MKEISEFNSTLRPKCSHEFLVRSFSYDILPERNYILLNLKKNSYFNIEFDTDCKIMISDITSCGTRIVENFGEFEKHGIKVKKNKKYKIEYIANMSHNHIFKFHYEGLTNI